MATAMNRTGCGALPLDQVVPGHYIVTPPASQSVEYLPRATQRLASSRSVDGSCQSDVTQTSMISWNASKRLAEKTSPVCQTSIGN